MGCNTSKESAAVPESENKENQENQQRSMNDQTVDVKEAAGDKNNEQNHVVEPSEKDSKSHSAKTITLPSNGSAKSIPGNKLASSESSKENKKGSRSREATENKVEPEQEAATKIQAAFRGHQTRKSMKQPGKAHQQQAELEPTRQELENEFRSDDEELCNAATKIQASFRGHMSRKHIEKKDDEFKDDKQGTSGEIEEMDIDLSDPDLNKAASKIQATFRGHVTRKELDGTGVSGKNQ